MLHGREQAFRVICRITIISLFTLILAGGIVRSSGSGMGCPDWPKCFGRVIPPVSESQLPANYRVKYVQQQVAKNNRFAKILDLLGHHDLATSVRKGETAAAPEVFNAAKTWTEYINRLIGALTGFLLLGCLYYSSTYLKTRKRIFYLSGLNCILVGFQAWLGSIVVSTNLLAWVVTVHMLLAIAIVAIVIYTYYEAGFSDQKMLKNKNTGAVKVIAVLAIVLTIAQIITGTTVREQIDTIATAMNNLNRKDWVQLAGVHFTDHRNLSAVITLINGLLILFTVRRFSKHSKQSRYAAYLLIILLLQLAVGVSLAYFSLPGFAQALHVTLAALLFSAQFYLLLLLNRSNALQPAFKK